MRASIVLLMIGLVALLGQFTQGFSPLKSRIGLLENARIRRTQIAVGISVDPEPIVETTVEGSRSDLVPDWVQELNKAAISVFKGTLLTQFEGRPYARFYALETIARVPYFSYTSVLHLYETIGGFRKKEFIKLHFTESWNELHHLLIMEELGGSVEFRDRFIATHLAFFYYWIVIALYMANPAAAYNFNMFIERHAFVTYDEFLKSNEEELKSLPVPSIAKEYYLGETSLFRTGLEPFTKSSDVAQYQGDKTFAEVLAGGQRNMPTKLDNLYDVFYEIREDERMHGDAMQMLSSNSIFEEKSE